MPPFCKPLTYLPVLLAIPTPLFSFARATPTPHASQSPSSSNYLSPRTQPFYNAATALTHHPKRAQFNTRGTFYRGLWTLALTTTAFLAQGPSSSTVAVSDIESFAEQILDKVATRIATGAAEKVAFGWGLHGVSITFRSWIDPVTNVAPGVPWGVVQEFVAKFVLERARRGNILAFSGNIWGPGGVCVGIVLQVAGAAGVGGGILDSASEIHGGG